MDVPRLLQLARDFAAACPYPVAATVAEDGSVSARVVQPMAVAADWTINTITNRRCRKVREIEATGRLTLIYQADGGTSYVSFSGPAEIVEDRDLKRAIWAPGHDLWNEGGPDNPATVFMRLAPDRIELWSAGQGVLPPPKGYSAAVLTREGEAWCYSAT